VFPDWVQERGASGRQEEVDRPLVATHRYAAAADLPTRLCEGGHVLVNGLAAKPSTRVRAGDRVEALIADRERVVEVVRPIESRVGAPVAETCSVDHSPPVVQEVGPEIMVAQWIARRHSGGLRLMPP